MNGSAADKLAPKTIDSAANAVLTENRASTSSRTGNLSSPSSTSSSRVCRHRNALLSHEYGAVGSNWRNIAITLIDPDFGEQTAQAGENACLQQSPNPIIRLAHAYCGDGVSSKRMTTRSYLLRHRRGNPNWGRPLPAIPDLPTQFELLVQNRTMSSSCHQGSYAMGS